MTRLAELLRQERVARPISGVLAALVAVVVLWHPTARGDDAAIADRIALALALVGAIGGISHGIGHQSERWLLPRLATPRVAWPLMTAGGLWLLLSGI
ncbi:MAG TPA: cyd operon YbgE family protein [Candidatus Sulfotelmatobacter sp.]|nr:cyd operon YbgE family protein [Candidatus Sulfotelmatobacter sp.]